MKEKKNKREEKKDMPLTTSLLTEEKAQELISKLHLPKPPLKIKTRK